MNDIVITGASSGMGKEFAKQSDKLGYKRMFLIARNTEKMQELADTLTTPCVIISVDLTDSNSLTVISDVFERENANISLLINGAGFGVFNEFATSD